MSRYNLCCFLILQTCNTENRSADCTNYYLSYIVCHLIVMEQVLYQNKNGKAVIFFCGYQSALVCDKVRCLRTTIHMPLR